jgi:BON domain
MQRWRVRRRDETPSVGAGLAFLAVGLVAGLALGTYLADRLGGVGGISARVRSRVGNAGGRRKGDAPESHVEPDVEPAEERAPFDHEYQEHEEWSAVDLGHDAALGVPAGELGDVTDEDEEMGDEDTDVFTSADPELEDRVLAAYTNDPVLCERAIDIGAIGPTTIELTGMVYTDDEYEHATVVTRGVPGVETVVNRLSVRDDDTSTQQSARRYSDGDPRYTEARWENERVGTGRRRQGTSQDVGRHADPKVPLESRALDAAEAVRDAADDIPPIRTLREEPTRRADQQPAGGDVGSP